MAMAEGRGQRIGYSTTVPRSSARPVDHSPVCKTNVGRWAIAERDHGHTRAHFLFEGGRP